MATAPGRASMSTGNTTSFGQFHQIQSHDPPAEPPNATLTDQNQMLRNSRPSIGPNNLDPRAQTTANHTPNQTTAPSANFGQVELVELSATATPEGVLGPNKDGRVRNPVPSKLKGKTDGKDGAFGVMHMDLSNGKKSDMAGKDVAAERDAAARRTSEKTASAAKAAQQSGYVPPRKRRIGGEEEQDEKPRPGRPLAPDETKYEQARLLTLLRSINPITVVDQLCKAVAYFGGIPGAPPPEDGIFPESANTRETGALFIGWLSEIFPDLSKAPSPEITRLHEPPKRSRGRPRKENGMPHDSVTPTDDTQGPAQGNAQAQQAQKPQVARPSWAQLPPPVMKSPEDTWGAPNEVAAQPEYVAPQTNPPQMDSTDNMEDEPADALDLFNHIQGQKPSTPNNLQSANTYSTNAHSGSNSTSKRGRGRPKGSRNKKLEEQQEEEARAKQNDTQNGIQQNTAEVQGQQPSTQQGAGSTSTTSNSGQNTEEEQRALIAQQQNLLFGKSLWGGQTQNGQPQKPSGTSHLDNLSVEEQAVVTAFRNQRPPGPSTTITNTTAISTPSGAGAKRKRPAPAQNNQPAQTFQGQQSVTVTPQAPLSHKTNDNPTNMAKEALQWDQMANTDTSTTTPATTSMTKDALQWDQLAPTSAPTTAPAPTKLAKDALQWGSVTPSSVAPTPVAPTPVAPPAKRQRKPKDPIAPPAKRKTASISSSKATPPTIPSTIPDSQATASSQSISQQNASQQGMSQPNIPQKSIPQQSIAQQSVPRPPAEGLEAHYERFANLQQNSRSHTPTVPQRQNTNTTSAAPQRQHTPSQSLQQAQKQRQQQAPQPQPQPADKTVEQIMSQTSSTASGTRPSSSNTFYNPTRYTPGQFSQQYPSHQPSQQYGSTQSQSQSQSQASPRASNSASNNSYRSGSTNTLARASPQFSQSQGHSNYRTASPHPLSQPSPSFSTADTSNFRAANPHSVSQTSPLYSPRTSQTQSSQQSHQSHYNHFPSSSYIDLPTLESLDHSGSGIGAGSTVGLNTGTYGQGLGVNRNTGTYGSSSGLNNAFDTGVRVSQSGNSHSGYGSTTSGINNAFDSTGTSEQDMRERLLGLGRR